ncbi:PIN domain-like protein [Armillaria gallica]|uniref:PIN domain-like protein n=1 Tax=Armillaria gallica TaxID=47427 RepID=A0A2H3DVU7_ARMGA|nr:PIN domain-like protein [Armillaria gallica]
MGIPKLWQIVLQSTQPCSLIEYTITHGIHNQNGSMLKIGIDASIWIVQCEAIFWRPRHAQAGENPELRTLLFRLAYLLQCAFIPIFVFDGPLRPGMKRGKKVSIKARWLERHFKDMISAFGFNHHDAPGEAEAELAHMNRVGMLDAIITEDSDTLVFGAKTILRRPSAPKAGKKTKTDPDLYSLYSAEHIHNAEGVRLTEGGLFLSAVLLGGDYTDGLQGSRGPLTCGSESYEQLSDFLNVWRGGLRAELLSPTISGASKHPALVDKINNDFPNVQVLKYYALPATSWSDGRTPPNENMWNPPLPDITRISAFCDRFFHWEQDMRLSRLRKNIWPGIMIQSLYRLGKPEFSTPGPSLHNVSDGSLANSSIQSIQKYTRSPNGYTVRIQTSLIDEQAIPDGPGSLSEGCKMNVKIPAILLYRALPLMVNVFHERKPQFPLPDFG